MDKDFREVFKPATDVLNKYKNVIIYYLSL